MRHAAHSVERPADQDFPVRLKNDRLNVVPGIRTRCKLRGAETRVRCAVGIQPQKAHHRRTSVEVIEEQDFAVRLYQHPMKAAKTKMRRAKAGIDAAVGIKPGYTGPGRAVELDKVSTDHDLAVRLHCDR